MADAPYPAGGEVAAKDKARAAFLAAHDPVDARTSFCLDVDAQNRASMEALRKEIELKSWALEELEIDVPEQAKRLPPNAVRFEGKWYIPK